MKFLDILVRLSHGRAAVPGRPQVSSQAPEIGELAAVREYLASHPSVDQSALDEQIDIPALLDSPLGPTVECLSASTLHEIVSAELSVLSRIGPVQFPRDTTVPAHVRTCAVCAENLALHRQIVSESRHLVREAQARQKGGLELDLGNIAKINSIESGSQILVHTVMTPMTSKTDAAAAGYPLLVSDRSTIPYLDPSSIMVLVSNAYRAYDVTITPMASPPGHDRWQAFQATCHIKMPLGIEYGEPAVLDVVKVEGRNWVGAVGSIEKTIRFEAAALPINTSPISSSQG